MENSSAAPSTKNIDGEPIVRAVQTIQKASSALQDYQTLYTCKKTLSMEIFSEAVKTVFANWTALQLAVQHQAGGPQSKEIAEWMTTVTENFIKDNEDLVPQEIEEYIEEILNNEFNTLCEDGSLEEIGRSLLAYYRLARAGKDEELKQELEKYKGSGAGRSKTEANDSNEPQEDEAPELVDATETTPKKKNQRNEPDEDGWVTVTKGKK